MTRPNTKPKTKRKVRVKICGITNWTDARAACDAGVDFLGFNFYRPSPRYIDPEKASRIVLRLPRNVAAVGVFVNESEDAMLQIARAVRLKYLQLHGDESPLAVSRLRRRARFVKVIKAIRVQRKFSKSQLRRFHYASAVLLDGFDARRYGGTGKPFDWSLASRCKTGQRIFLAGGLTPDNVADAIRSVRPYAIDICSGVESKPGKKDCRKIKALIQAINGSNSARHKT